MWKILLAVFLGGGIGSVMRYAVQCVLHRLIVPFLFPWATFGVNVLGSFLIGLFYVWAARFNLPETTRLLLTTGLSRVSRRVRHYEISKCSKLKDNLSRLL